MFQPNVLCITRKMASKRFLCFLNVFLIVMLLLSSAMGSRDLSKIAKPRVILEKAINPQNGPRDRHPQGLPQGGNYGPGH